MRAKRAFNILLPKTKINPACVPPSPTNIPKHEAGREGVCDVQALAYKQVSASSPS